jgi:hypothetical protein
MHHRCRFDTLTIDAALRGTGMPFWFDASKLVQTVVNQNPGTILAPIAKVGVNRSGGSASRISGRAALKPVRKVPMDNTQLHTEEVFG